MKSFFYVLGLGLPLMALAQATTRPNTQEKKVERAVDRCKAQRGIDCDTPQGLQEWMLQERSRSEAVRDGSRHRIANTPAPR